MALTKEVVDIINKNVPFYCLQDQFCHSGLEKGKYMVLERVECVVGELYPWSSEKS